MACTTITLFYSSDVSQTKIVILSNQNRRGSYGNRVLLVTSETGDVSRRCTKAAPIQKSHSYCRFMKIFLSKSLTLSFLYKKQKTQVV